MKHVHDTGYMRRGLTFIDVIISVAILVFLFGGIYLVYFSIVDVVNNLELRTLATSLLNRQMEVVRNISYESVGTVGGVPSGIIPQEQVVAMGDVSFKVKTVVRNIDDPFDGTLGSNPNDTAPADYKLVELEVSCASCSKFVPLVLTGRVAPKSLESSSNNGSLFVKAIDANGLPITQVDVHVVNASVTPAIDLNDATNVAGVLQLVGVSTSTQGYQIAVSKQGYSSDKTYRVGDPVNPNPVKPHATVAAQTVTEITFSIDRTSAVNVSTTDSLCSPIGNKSFSIRGSKLIGTNPDVLKFSTTTATGALGSKKFTEVEWDTYSLSLNEAADDVLGTLPLLPLVINPSSTLDFGFILRPAAPRSLLATLKNAVGGGGIPAGASVNLSKSGFSETVITGRSSLTLTDWSGGAYSSQNGGVETDNPTGSLALKLNASSTYTTSTVNWLISNTIDFGSSSSTFYGLKWNPDPQPPPTGSESLKFQIATNNDQDTWDFLGPDGTGGTYYVNSSATINSVHGGNRYLRYKVFLKTDHENFTSELQDVTIEFRGVCVPPSQALFNNLALDTYTLDVTALGFTRATSSVSITGSWQQTEALMTAQ